MADYRLNQWIEIDDYLIRVEDIRDEIIVHRTFSNAEEIHAVRLLVAYQNKKRLPLKHVGLQWLLYDTAGYSYNNDIWLKLFGNNAIHKLQEGHIRPGKEVKGWVAFKMPKDAVPDYVQFRSNFMTSNIATISLAKLPITFEKEPAADASPNLLQKMWQTVKPAKSDTLPLTLEPGSQYVFKKPIIDFYGNSFAPGDQLTYEKSYPPYQGLHTLLFAEGTLYLHEDNHADIFADMARFIAPEIED